MVGVSPREEQILEILRDGDEISVATLSKKLDVSAVTIRSDLRNLEGKGFVVRSHGGAVLASFPLIAKKRNQHLTEKEAIAKAAASFVENGSEIMITNGTTCSLIPRYLINRNVKIVTNSTLLLPYARANTGIDLTLIGGNFIPEVEGIIGYEAIEQIESFHVSITFFGTDGLTLEHGLTTGTNETALVVKKMCNAADRKILVADSSKIGNKGFFRIMKISQIGTLITDRNIPEDFRKSLIDMGVEVIIAQ